MRRKKDNQWALTLVFMLSLLSCITPAIAESTVEWVGEKFLDVTYKEVGATKVKMDLYMPLQSQSKPSPVLYYIHGGGWAAGSKDKGGLPKMLPVFRKVANKGFVCVSINYRLCKKNSGVLMRDCVIDCMDGIRFLKKHADQYGIDVNRIVVWGDSAGGHLAQMLTLADPNAFIGMKSLADFSVKPIAGISWYGPTDFTDINLFKTDLAQRNPDRFGARITGKPGAYRDHPKAYEEMSPYFWISKDSPSLLILQGDSDATIPLAHAHHLKKKADQIGAGVTMIIVKNAGHNWRSSGGNPEPDIQKIQQLTAEFSVKSVQSIREKK